MIRYNLICDNEHNFESWFRDSTSCHDQIKSRNVFCPECNSNVVTKALMSPRIPKKGNINNQKNTVLSNGRTNNLNDAIRKIREEIKNFLKKQERFITKSQKRDQSMVRQLQKISKNYMKKA